VVSSECECEIAELTRTNLERNVLVAESDLKLLSPVLVLLWPLCVVFPVFIVSLDTGEVTLLERTYFIISLSLMIFLISAIRMELTHTVDRVSSPAPGKRFDH
jgi:hypothetical protein